MTDFETQRSNGTYNSLLMFLLAVGLCLFSSGLYFISHRNSYTALIELSVLLPGLALILSRPGRILLWRLRWEFAPLLALLSYAVARILVDYGFERSSYLAHAIEPLIFVAAVTVLAQADRKSFENWLLAAMLAVALMSVAHLVYWYWVLNFPLATPLLKGESLDGAPIERLMGFRNPLEAGMIATAAYFVLLGYQFRESLPQIQRWLVWLGMACLLCFILLLQRRTGYVALFGVSLSAIFMVGELRVRVMFAVLTVLAVGIWLQAPEVYTNRGFSYRPQEWVNALVGSFENPIFGHGFGVNVETYIEGKRVGLHAHNMHLGTLYGLGLAGLLLWLWIWLPDALRMAVRRPARADMVYVLPLYSGMIYGCFELGDVFSQINEHWFITWLPIALLIANRSYKNNQCHAPDLFVGRVAHCEQAK